MGTELPKICKNLILGKPIGHLSKIKIYDIFDNNCDFLLNELPIEDLRGIDKEFQIKLAELKFYGHLYKKQIEFLIKILTKARSKFVILKGAKDVMILKQNYVKYADIDVFVKKEDIKKIKSALLKGGYKDLEYFSKDYLNKYGFHLVLYNKKFKHCVEVHWMLMDRQNPFSFYEEEIWKKNIVPCPTKKYLYYFKPEFEAIYLITACYFKDFGSTFLITAFRIRKIIQAGFKFQIFEELVESHNCQEVVSHFIESVRSKIGWSKEYEIIANITKKRGNYIKNAVISIFFCRGFYKRKKNSLWHWLFLNLYSPSLKNTIYLFNKGISHMTIKFCKTIKSSDII